MSDDAFEAAFAILLRHEGGFQNDPDDRGNWTGGAVGQGTLKGTKYGISAAVYPALDIALLTEADAAAIYRRDYWDRYGFGMLPAVLAAKLLDAAVLAGPAVAITGLQRGLRACGYRAIAEDGALGHDTSGAAASADPVALLPALREALAGHYRAVAQARPAQARFLAGWLKRAYDES